MTRSKAYSWTIGWLLCFLVALATPAVSQSNRVSVLTIDFQSKLVQKRLPYNVVLPSGYSNPKDNNVSYPVLYLLHGLSGHYSDWTARTKLAEYAESYRMVIVTPEGNDGWYTDSAISPLDQYETYIVRELIPDVERRFRVATVREGRAIAGLSMGGYGALKFAVKYPEKFAFAASMSGALDAATWTAQDLEKLKTIFRSLGPVFGEPKSQTRIKNDLHKLYNDVPEDRLSTLPFLYLDCGTEDPLLASTRTFAELLLRRKIPHEVRLLPGAHGWVYWNQQVGEVLRLAARHLRPAG